MGWALYIAGAIFAAIAAAISGGPAVFFVTLSGFSLFAGLIYAMERSE